MHIDNNRPAANLSRAARMERLQEAVAGHSEKVAQLSPQQVASQRQYCATALDDIQSLRTNGGLGFPKLS